jgi:hypothetical protein
MKFLKVVAWSVAVLIVGFIGLVIEEMIQHPEVAKQPARQPVQPVQKMPAPTPTPVVTPSTPTPTPTPTPAPTATLAPKIVDGTTAKLAAEIAANRQDLSSRRQDALVKINSGKESYNDLLLHEDIARKLSVAEENELTAVSLGIQHPLIPSNLPANVQEALLNAHKALAHAYGDQMMGFGKMMSSLEVRHVGNYDQANMQEAESFFNKSDSEFDQALQYIKNAKGEI